MIVIGRPTFKLKQDSSSMLYHLDWTTKLLSAGMINRASYPLLTVDTMGSVCATGPAPYIHK